MFNIKSHICKYLFYRFPMMLKTQNVEGLKWKTAGYALLCSRCFESARCSSMPSQGVKDALTLPTQVDRSFLTSILHNLKG